MAPLQQRSPPPPRPEEPPRDIEMDRMDVDQPEFVRFPHRCHFFNSHQLALPLLLLGRRILQQRTIYYIL